MRAFTIRTNGGPDRVTRGGMEGHVRKKDRRSQRVGRLAHYFVVFHGRPDVYLYIILHV